MFSPTADAELRRRIEAIRMGQVPPVSGDSPRRFRIIHGGAKPTAIRKYYLGVPVTATGEPSEGGMQTLVAGSNSDAVPILVLGPGVPATGSDVLAYPIQGTWVASSGGTAGGQIICPLSCTLSDQVTYKLDFKVYQPILTDPGYLDTDNGTGILLTPVVEQHWTQGLRSYPPDPCPLTYYTTIGGTGPLGAPCRWESPWMSITVRALTKSGSITTVAVPVRFILECSGVITVNYANQYSTSGPGGARLIRTCTGTYWINNTVSKQCSPLRIPVEDSWLAITTPKITLYDVYAFPIAGITSILGLAAVKVYQ